MTNEISAQSGTIPQKSLGISKIWEEGKNPPMLSKTGMFWHLVHQAWRSFLVAPLISLVTLLTIALVMFLFSTFVLILQNLGDALRESQSALSFNIFLKDGTPSDAADKIVKELQSFPAVESVNFISKDKALLNFKQDLGSAAQILEGLQGQNPLPDSVEVKIKNAESPEPVFEALSKKFANAPAVEEVQYSSGLLWQLSAIMKLFKFWGSVAVVLLIVMTTFIISNTIKLALYSRGDELAIMRLVGATRAFIRAPCLIEGLIQGLLGAGLGILILYGIYAVFGQALAKSDVLEILFPRFHFISVSGISLVVTFGIFSGVLGSYLAVRPFLRD